MINNRLVDDLPRLSFHFCLLLSIVIPHIPIMCGNGMRVFVECVFHSTTIATNGGDGMKRKKTSEKSILISYLLLFVWNRDKFISRPPSEYLNISMAAVTCGDVAHKHLPHKL